MIYEHFEPLIDLLPTTRSKLLGSHMLLSNPMLVNLPASLSKHHSYVGGWLDHTQEVMQYTQSICALWPILNEEVALLGALFHDSGKVREYKLKAHLTIPYQEAEYRLMGRTFYEKTKFKEIIRHIPFSYYLLLKSIESSDIEYRFTQEEIDEISHCILAHHGRQEFGSPVEPQTMEALLVNQADVMSSMKSEDGLIENVDSSKSSLSNYCFAAKDGPEGRFLVISTCEYWDKNECLDDAGLHDLDLPKDFTEEQESMFFYSPTDTVPAQMSAENLAKGWKILLSLGMKHNPLMADF